jgi:hypothetical protein
MHIAAFLNERELLPVGEKTVERPADAALPTK